MNGHEILNYVFDSEMFKSIMDFSREITESVADVYIVMSRKAACFIAFLERHGFVSLNGIIVTDRILDLNDDWLFGKNVAIVDDVIVSGTTVYTIIDKLKNAMVGNIEVYVLGINTDAYNPEMLEYYDENGELKSYIHTPYILLSNEACMRMCSNIVSVFALDVSPYDVDFPRHDRISVSKSDFERIIGSPEWHSYDVSSDLQAENDVKNITMLPTERIQEVFNNAIGFPMSDIGFYKIRIFARNLKGNNKKIEVNIIPFFLFNEISSDDISSIFEKWFGGKISDVSSTQAQVRILQFCLAEKLFQVFWDSVLVLKQKGNAPIFNKKMFARIFKADYYSIVVEMLNTSLPMPYVLKFPIQNVPNSYGEDFQSRIEPDKERLDNIAVLQTKLIEPFTYLYFDKEERSRRIVLEHGKEAFDSVEYKEIIDRLKHGYSYRFLIELLRDFPETYDKETTVSLFLDEAIDAGIVVPIIAEEVTSNNLIVFFRAYRHGEDVPFGELQEKLCAILLESYSKIGQESILSKLRVEKLLVLFIRIGMMQKIFRPSPQDNIYYNVNIDAYLYGNIPTVQDVTSRRPYHYLKHRNDAIWLFDVLVDKGIIKTKNNVITRIEDSIDVDVDRSTRGKVSAIGMTFAHLYNNAVNGKTPYANDKDLVLFSTCVYPNDILNALAAELAIFEDRWRSKSAELMKLSINNPTIIPKEITSSDLYTAINSGQQKFFSFIERRAQIRIAEISEQFNSALSVESIYGTYWDQFWSDNRNWKFSSIEPQLRNTILKEGKLLVVFNALLRSLFYCTCEVSQRQRWKNEITKYQNKLDNPVFSSLTDLEEIKKAIRDLVKNDDLNNFKTWTESILTQISKYDSYIHSLLADVELLIDRHGKACKIKRYSHAILLNVCNEEFTQAGKVIKAVLSSLGAEYQEFPISVPNDIFHESGVWVFLKSSNPKKTIKRMLNSFVYEQQDRLHVRCIKVFYNLSDDLRLKIADNSNTRQQFGFFSSYNSNLSCNSLFNTTDRSWPHIYWIFENSTINMNSIVEMKKELSPEYEVSDCHTQEFQTAYSSASTIWTIVPKSKIQIILDKQRERYLSMSSKCKVFISYTEDSQEHVARVARIAERLKEEGIIVYYMEDLLLGTDLIEFMRKIRVSDITLIIGTTEYKKRAYSKNNSGANFEDRIISTVFMSDDREKIIPVAFGNFNESIPEPFSELKGMHMTIPTDEELDTLVAGVLKRYHSNKKS